MNRHFPRISLRSLITLCLLLPTTVTGEWCDAPSDLPVIRRLSEFNSNNASSIFAIHSPQECLAGQYCAGRSGSSSGTGPCPTGTYCGPGSIAPLVAGAGQFVGSSGSVRSYGCSSGTFGPYSGLPFCLPCPPGYSCVEDSTVTPTLCSAGTYRPSSGELSVSGTNLNLEVAALNSISCLSCPEGTYSPWRGVPDVTSCEPCPGGRVCLTKTANITASNPCAEGYLCGEGATLTTSTTHLCYNGFFCPKESTPTSVYTHLCAAAFVCKEGTTFADRFRIRCPTGFYCPTGSPWKSVMQYPLVPAVAYLSSGQFYVLQVAAQYCLRQSMMTTMDAIASQTGITDDQRSIQLSLWGGQLTSCVLAQIPHLPLLSRNTDEVASLISEFAEWHASQLLALAVGKNLAEYSNKCNPAVYPRVDMNTPWDCLCSSNATNGSLLGCLTTPFVGAPFTYSASYSIDDATRNCADWPDCIDWARLDLFAASGESNATKATGPSTGGVTDDFDALSVSYVDYIAESLKHNFLIFAVDSATSVTACPFGTLSSADGLSSLDNCVKRELISTDPDDIVVYRVNPVSRALSNQGPRTGYPVSTEEDLRLVFTLPARNFATITLDVRDLPSAAEYGRDWRVVVYLDNTLGPDSNDPQICRDIWKSFLDYHWTTASGYPASLRDHKLKQAGCTVLWNPFAFSAFEYATGSACPDSASSQCYFFTLDSASAKAACSTQSVSVHELYLHALVDVEFRIEVQIVNGMFMPDRFKFIHAVSVDVAAPSRAALGTTKAFVIETNAEIASAVYYPFNLPVMPTTADLETIYNKVPSGNVSSVAAVSQSGIISKAFYSWLPREQSVPLTNCFRHTSGWQEFLYDSGTYYSGGRTSVYQTHLPYFSNCRGFGSAIPLWFILEREPGCDIVPQNETKPISEVSFGASSFGDSCVDNGLGSKPVEIECMVDEVLNNKQPLPRWFESQTGAELFRISFDPLTPEAYAKLDEKTNPISSTIPVILRQGARTDGTWLRRVDLDLRYWQWSSSAKVITTADVYFSDFAQLTDAQSKGRDTWNYTLAVSWSPMSHIEVFNAYAFSFPVYMGFAVSVGFLSVAIMLGHWAYHWAMSPTRFFSTKVYDKRYWQLLFPPLIKGVLLALVPIVIAFMVMILVFQGETSLFSASLFKCDPASAFGCRISLLDPMYSSWSGESMSSPNSYQTRRNGRAATVLLVLGAYLILMSIKAFIPNLVSHYYDEVPGAASAEKKDEEEEEEDRSWPPDQQIFAPLIHKRSAWFLVITLNCIVCTLVMEFSYSVFYTSLWWVYLVGIYALGKFVGWATVWIMKEELLKIPVVALFDAVVQVITLGSPDYYSFIVTLFITQAMFLADRLYLTPNEGAIGKAVAGLYTKSVRNFKFVLSGGKLVDAGAEAAVDASTAAAAAGEGLTRSVLPSSERDQGDGMMYLLSSYSSNALAAILTPLMIVMLSLMYQSAQTLNYYNVSLSQAKYYFGFQLAMLFFKYVADLISLNTAETFHEWKILDYLEYCRYRFQSRPDRWKGINEISDELITPELRSLDLMCFSSQFFFACFLNAFGAMLFLVGVQVTVNNAWNIFDDQATPFIILGGMLLLGICRFACIIGADYLKVWFVKQRGVDGGDTDTVDAGGETEQDGTARIAQLLTQDGDSNREKSIAAPLGSALYNWPEPSAGDKAGWERYRLAYLRENQLWLQAHMDGLIDGPTSVEFRRLLMDSLASVLKESNILELTKRPIQDAPVSPTIRGLEFSALPPHDPAVRGLEDARALTRGTGLELAARFWLVRARFLRFLRESVFDLDLNQAILRDYCEACGGRGGGLSVVPEYPVSFIADQLRIQRDYTDTWNMPLWQHFYKTFTPGCTLCISCAGFYAVRNVPIPVNELRERVMLAMPRTCEQVLRESPFPLPMMPLPDLACRLLIRWLDWATEFDHPEPPTSDAIEAMLAHYGYASQLDEARSKQISPGSDDAHTFPVVPVSDETKALLMEWLSRARRQ